MSTYSLSKRYFDYLTPATKVAILDNPAREIYTWSHKVPFTSADSSSVINIMIDGKEAKTAEDANERRKLFGLPQLGGYRKSHNHRKTGRKSHKHRKTRRN